MSTLKLPVVPRLDGYRIHIQEAFLEYGRWCAKVALEEASRKLAEAGYHVCADLVDSIEIFELDN